MALDFTPGSSQYVNIGLDIPTLNAAPACTVMAWVNPDAFGATRSVTEQSIGPPPGTSGTSRVFFNINSSGTIQIGARDADGGGSFVLNGVTSLVAGVWSHVAAVVDVAGDVNQLYINGVLDAAGTPAFPNATFPATNSKNGCVAANDDGTGQYANGLIEDFRMYRRRLAPSEILAVYTARGTDGIADGMVERWLMREGAPGVLAVGVGTVKGSSSGQRNIDPINSPVYQPGAIRLRRKVA